MPHYTRAQRFGRAYVGRPIKAIQRFASLPRVQGATRVGVGGVQLYMARRMLGNAAVLARARKDTAGYRMKMIGSGGPPKTNWLRHGIGASEAYFSMGAGSLAYRGARNVASGSRMLWTGKGPTKKRTFHGNQYVKVAAARSASYHREYRALTHPKPMFGGAFKQMKRWGRRAQRRFR